MKLRYSPTSPFVRKVVVLAKELGIENKIELQKTSTTDPDLATQNPLGKVPSLLLDDGSSLYDSPVICAYIDSATKFIRRADRRAGPLRAARHWPTASWMPACWAGARCCVPPARNQRSSSKRRS
ncbi:MAG TPA: glutathione S-transferase N-terminal domain-containing protein [Candidatus Polarisedimenticolia bacterium]|nr:glutathione S-transferase N-terminal domain-containing protein [Candidatus Polarisedimenticolia bacterium]